MRVDLRDLWDKVVSVLNVTDHFKEIIAGLTTLILAALLAYLVLNRGPSAASRDEGETGSSGTTVIVGSPERPTAIFAPVIIVDTNRRVEWVRDTLVILDKDHKKMGVEVGILWDPYRWVLGSTSRVGIDSNEYLSIEDVFASSPGAEVRPIIAVGLASNENSGDNPADEEARAETRADRLVELCQRRYPDADIYSLNLGFYRGAPSPSASSASERRVVLMVLTWWEEGADLESGVRNALIEAANRRSFSFDARNYSNFDERKFSLLQRQKRGRWKLGLNDIDGERL